MHCLCKGIVDFGYESLTVVIRQLVDFIDLIAQLLKLVQGKYAAVDLSTGGNWGSFSKSAIPLGQLRVIWWVSKMLHREPRLPCSTV